MIRPPLFALILAGALASPSSADTTGWLGGARTTKEERLPQKRFKRLKAKDKQLSQVLKTAMKAVYQEAPPPKLALNPAQGQVRVTLDIRNGNLAELLDIAGAATGMTLRIQDSELTAQSGYRQPDIRPPTPGELHSLMQKFTLKAKEQEAGKVLRMLANVLGISAATPKELEHVRVTLHCKGNAAQALETLSSQLGRRAWVDGRALRVSTACDRIIQPEATYDNGLRNKIKRLKAKDQALSKVVSLLSMAAKRTAQVDPSIAGVLVDLDVSVITIPQVLEQLEAKYPITAEVDGVFLRVRPRSASPCPTLSGSDWKGLVDLVYPRPSTAQEFGIDTGSHEGDDFGLGSDDFGDF